MFHLKAIEVISRSLRSAVKGEPVGREGMALGQYIAGMGFSNVGLGVDHSMAHTLSAYYDMPHGKACATLLPTVMAYNADYTGEKYREIARAMGVEGVDAMSQAEYRAAAVAAVQKLAEDVGIVTSLKGVVKEEDLPQLAKDAYADACRPGNRVTPAWRYRGTVPQTDVIPLQTKQSAAYPINTPPPGTILVPDGRLFIVYCIPYRSTGA